MNYGMRPSRSTTMTMGQAKPREIRWRKKMRVAITGANGFVGSHLTQRLESEGHELVLISKRPRKDDDRLNVNAFDDAVAMTELFKGDKAFAHCAGINRETGAQTYQRVHVDATRNVVEAARAAGGGRGVLVSFLPTRAP